VHNNFIKRTIIIILFAKRIPKARSKVYSSFSVNVANKKLITHKMYLLMI